ncbi:hypothetical protein TorRG33x02_183960, partial [Trema orientale]
NITLIAEPSYPKIDPAATLEILLNTLPGLLARMQLARSQGRPSSLAHFDARPSSLTRSASGGEPIRLFLLTRPSTTTCSQINSGLARMNTIFTHSQPLSHAKSAQS